MSKEITIWTGVDGYKMINKELLKTYGWSEDYPIQDNIWPSRWWNKDKTDYIDLSG